MKDHNCYLFIVFTTLLSVLQEKTLQIVLHRIASHRICVSLALSVCVCALDFIFFHSRFHYYLENAVLIGVHTNDACIMDFSTEIMYAKWF